MWYLRCRLSSSDNLSSRYQITLHQELCKVYWNVSSFLSCNTTPRLQPKQPMSRFLAWSVRFVTKIQKRIFDPQRRWIPWIISKTGYLGYMIRSVSLLRIRKEWILPAVTRNNFNIQISCLATLLISKAAFDPEAWIKRSILSALSGYMVKSQYKQDLHFFSSQGQTSPARRVLQDFNFLIHNLQQHIMLLQDSSSFGPSKAVFLS